MKDEQTCINISLRNEQRKYDHASSMEINESIYTSNARSKIKKELVFCFTLKGARESEIKGSERKSVEKYIF